MAAPDVALPAVLMANRRRIDCQRDHFSLRNDQRRGDGGGGGRVSGESLTRLTARTEYFAYERPPLLCFLPIHKPLSLLSRGMRHEWQLTLPHECISRLSTLGVRWEGGKKITSVHGGDAFRRGVHVSRIGFSRVARDDSQSMYAAVCACVCVQYACACAHCRRALLEERRHETRCNLIDREA